MPNDDLDIKGSQTHTVMFCAIWYHLYTLKNVKNTHECYCNFTKSNTPPWVFFTFLKLYRWYQIAQRVTYGLLLIWSLTNLTLLVKIVEIIFCYSTLYQAYLPSLKKLMFDALNKFDIKDKQSSTTIPITTQKIRYAMRYFEICLASFKNNDFQILFISFRRICSKTIKFIQISFW